MGKTRLKVGLFVTISFFILATAILWLAGSRFLQPVDNYHIIFSKSVSGLLPGAAVEYQGVTVGKVTKIRLTEETPPRVAVTIGLEPGTPARQDTTALLIGSLVTGIRIIELEGGSADAPPLEPEGAIPVQKEKLEAFRDRASLIADRLTTILTRIEEDLLSPQNSQAIADLLRNVAGLSENLRISLEEVSTADSRESLKKMVDNLAQAAAGIRNVTDAVNEIRVDLFNEGKTMMVQIRQTAAVTANLAKEVAQLTRHIDELIGENRYDLNQTLNNLSEASRHLKETVGAVQRDPSELIWGKNLPEKEIPDK